MKTERMQLKTFEKKLNSGNFTFHYANFKNHGWSGRNINWIREDLEYFKRNNISGIVEVKIAEQIDIDRAERKRQEAIREQRKQEKLMLAFRFSFGYSVTIPNSLTTNKYIYKIDKTNKILKRSWNGIITYDKLTNSELIKHSKEFEKIKQMEER